MSHNEFSAVSNNGVYFVVLLTFFLVFLSRCVIQWRSQLDMPLTNANSGISVVMLWYETHEGGKFESFFSCIVILDCHLIFGLIDISHIITATLPRQNEANENCRRNVYENWRYDNSGTNGTYGCSKHILCISVPFLIFCGEHSSFSIFKTAVTGWHIWI